MVSSHCLFNDVREPMFKTPLSKKISNKWLFVFLLLLLPVLGFAQEESPESGEDHTLPALKSFVELKQTLERDIKQLNKALRAAQTDAEKREIQARLEKIQADLKATGQNFEDIAASVNISLLREEKPQKFNFQEEVFSLLKPAIDEMKSMTAGVRQKSELKEKIARIEERLPVIEQALANSQSLQKQAKDKSVKKALKETTASWQKQRDFMQTELQASQLQLQKILDAETSLAESSQTYFKTFFQKRGLYLIEALLVIVAVILLSRFSIAAMRRYLPGFKAKHRSFRIRLIELIHRIVTIFLIIIGPMVVFYLVEDWVLFSLGILLLIGIAWTLRQALPLYWHQVELFLNIGSVREGERIYMEGLPWRVEQINVFCRLFNPEANMSLRVPIADIVGMKSRPCDSNEPWFPCKEGDWVILSDENRGKVIGISPEFVQIVQRGGAQMTYQTADFLALSPRNLATNFRIKELLGISYSHQDTATTKIPEMLVSYLQQRIDDEGYTDALLSLKVEFAQANSSSLDLVVIADFQGEHGDIYNRLRRAIQRWCVDACSEYGWEIPFPQMTLHADFAGETGN